MASRLHRLIKLIGAVRGKTYPNVQQLCDKLQIKERTLFNDLKELKEDLGVQIEFDRHRKGYFLSSNDAEISLMSLTQDNAMLLLLSFSLLSSRIGEAGVAALREAFKEDIASALDLNANDIVRMGAVFRPQEQIAIKDRSVLLTLGHACVHGRTVRIGLNDNSYELMPLKISVSSDDLKLHHEEPGIPEDININDINKIEIVHTLIPETSTRGEIPAELNAAVTLNDEVTVRQVDF